MKSLEKMQRIVDFFAESCFCCFLSRPQDYDGEEDADEAELPDITPEMEADIEAALSTSSTVTLVSAFRMDITRKDIDTLKGLNWLNDEIINFYLQMIVERSKGGGGLMEFKIVQYYFCVNQDNYFPGQVNGKSLGCIVCLF